MLGRQLRTTSQHFTKFFKNVKIIEFQYHIIWNHHEKCMEKSTNMPNIGSVMIEIDFENCEYKNLFTSSFDNLFHDIQ